MILLPGLLLVLWGEPGRCLEEGEGFEFEGDIRHFAVADNNVYIATEERLYQLSHDLTLVQSLTQRGVLKSAKRLEDEQFYRVSGGDEWNATLSINVLLPFVENGTLISCGVTSNDCGYCELLDMKDISHVLYREHFQVGPPWRSSASVSFLVNVERSSTETYILTAIQQHVKPMETRCSTGSHTVNLHNTNDEQRGFIFSSSGDFAASSIKREGDINVEFVDGFQVDLIIYLLSNLPSSDNSNKVRLIWLEGKTSKTQTFKSLRGATLSISDGGKASRLLASSVVPGGPRVLWSGVFSVDGEQINTELVLFDISPDLTGATDQDPDFCSTTCTDKPKPTPKTLKPKVMLLRQNHMSSVRAVRHKAWMVFFIGTGDGQLIKLAVDNNYNTACPRVLYRANDDCRVLRKIHVDQVDRKHVYVPFQKQMKRVPVSKCSTYTNVQDCWSAQDPYCVWCGSKTSCTFEDDCQDSDWLSIPDDSQHKMVSHKVAKDSSDQITLTIRTHVTAGREALSNFACQFSTSSGELCTGVNPQFPQCTCTLTRSTLPANGLPVTVKIRFGTTKLSEQLKVFNCADIKGPPTSVLCRQCINFGCGWSQNGCSWRNEGEENDSVCPSMEPGMNISRPEIFSISPSVVSFYGRNSAVLNGRNLNDVTRVRIQVDMDCTTQESPAWSNTGVTLTFHIPSTDYKGEAKICVVLPDGSCHGNAKITYRSSPTCNAISPSSSWVSGKRTITLMVSYQEFVEGVIHSHAMHNVRPLRNSSFHYLTYDTPAAENKGIFTSRVFLKVADKTLACSATMTYYPDPDFTSFTATRTVDRVQIIIEKKADKLDMTMAEMSAWGVQDGKQYPCIMKFKETRDQTDFIHCDIQKAPDAMIQQLMITYGDKIVMLGTLETSLLHQVLFILRILLIPCIIVVSVVIHRWLKKTTSEMNKL